MYFKIRMLLILNKRHALARRFRLALNRYIARETAQVKLCSYQVMINDGLFEETNEQHIFSKVFYN